MAATDRPGAEAAARGYEVADVPVRRVAVALVAILGSLILTMAVLGVFYRFELDGEHQARPEAPALARIPVVPPEPSLLADQAAQRQAIEAAAAARLSSYGWTDRDAGIAHIPIARAMAILAERGWPEVPTGQGGAAARPVDRPRPPEGRP